MRFRPPLATEEPLGDESAFLCDTSQSIVESVDLQHRFTFDHVFDQDATQQSVFDDLALPLVNDVLQGYHATILAYGQTGGGKTYSMFGPQGPHSADLQGLVPRAAQQVFERVGTGPNCSGEFAIECNFVEVYCEQIQDLLTPGNNKLQVKEMPNKGCWVDGLTHKAVNSTVEVLHILRVALRHRAAANTRLNQHSSRSHAIFTLHVMQHTSEGVRHSKLTLVDLAGSEKVAKSGSTGEMLDQAKKINSSLSALGHVIDALADKRPHVPYRDSRLTRILEDSLGGNCRTTLLVACSLNSCHAAETMSALRFAGRAKKVCNMVYLRSNEAYPVDRQLLTRIASLRRELSKAHQELERRFDGKSDANATQAVRSPQRRGHRPLLRSLNEDALDQEQELIADSGGTGCQPQLADSVSSSSLCDVPSGSSTLAGCRGGEPTLLEEPCASSSAGTGASREDARENEPKSSPEVLSRQVDELMIAVLPSPQASSDAASTAVGSASSSAAVPGESVSVTPMSSRWDLGDDDVARRKVAVRGRGAQIPAQTGVIGSLAAVLANKEHDVQECEVEKTPGDVRIQQDLHWKLELERHRNAALNFELDRRAQESKDLRRQLEEAEYQYHSFVPAPPFIATGTPRLTGSGASMPLLSQLPGQGAAAVPSAAVAAGQEFGRTATPLAFRAVQHGAVVQGVTSPQRGSVVQRTTSVSRQRGEVQRGQVVVEASRTASSSPLRLQRAAYSGGLQRAAAAAGAAAPWASPRQNGPHRTSLQRSGSQPKCRLYASMVPPSASSAVGATSPRTGVVVTRPVSPGRLGSAKVDDTSVRYQSPSRLGSARLEGARPQSPSRLPSCSSFGTLTIAPGSMQGTVRVPASLLDPPVPMVPGSAAEKAIAELREELQRWVNSVT